MKILLTTLNAKYVHSNLALKYLYAAAEALRLPVELREFTINNDDDYIFCELIRGDYDLICFSCYVWNIGRTRTLAENVKKARPEIRLLFGGPEVSFEPERFLRQNTFVDFLITGEGERAFARLMERLTAAPVPVADSAPSAQLANANTTPFQLAESAAVPFQLADHAAVVAAGSEPKAWEFQGVAGLAWRQGECINVNPQAPPIPFDSVPFPYDTLPCEADKVAYYESVRGCPFRCAYCLSSVDKALRALSMERVRTDLSYFIYKRVKQVKFIDRTFNYDPRRCAEILDYLMSHDNGVTNFHFEICGDLLDETTLRLLERARPGLFQLEIGVQSTNRATLESIERRCDFEKLSRSVNRIRAAGGVHLHLDLIAGLPYEDYLTFKQSFNDVYALRPHDLQLGFLKLLPGTPLREKASEYRYVYRQQAPYEVISTAWLSADGLVRLKMIEHVLDLYYNRGGFERTVERAAFVLYATPFDFYQELANYYYLSGFQHKSHKKEDQYRILRAFFLWRNRRIEKETAAVSGDNPGERDQERGLSAEVGRHREIGSDCGCRQEAHRQETAVFELLEQDLKRTMNPDAVKKFEKKGWELE